MTPDLDDLTKEEVGALIKELRTNARRSPEWVADKLRLSVRTVNNWESGRNRASVADVMAYETLTKSKVADLLKAMSSWDAEDQSEDLDRSALAA